MPEFINFVNIFPDILKCYKSEKCSVLNTVEHLLHRRISKQPRQHAAFYCFNMKICQIGFKNMELAGNHGSQQVGNVTAAVQSIRNFNKKGPEFILPAPYTTSPTAWPTMTMANARRKLSFFGFIYKYVHYDPARRTRNRLKK
ncbi:hypothetical protein NPIL_258641 [Nephila pilipes]|uniref:Uncharacterized protein n=1 Tax=Nephila pilipes TaxID=299642 RepID=A0A8X6NRS1_NEPPI|nr:hypothetical protein NPIL_258641 [Nephila pilipes]